MVTKTTTTAQKSVSSTVSDHMKIVAIGDVHGCVKQLVDIIERPEITGDELILLGDLFDRSPFFNGDSLTLALVRLMQEQPQEFGFNKVTVLRGNHEDAIIRSIEQGPESSIYDLWQYNGGDAEFYETIRDSKPTLEWLKSLPLYVIRGDYMFVHGGVRPDVPLEEQTEQDLLWIREEFHDAEDHGLPYTVVHGHTPVPQIDVAHKRINLDTGSFFSGNLSFMEFEYVESMGSEAGEVRQTNDRDCECAHAV